MVLRLHQHSTGYTGNGFYRFLLIVCDAALIKQLPTVSPFCASCAVPTISSDVRLYPTLVVALVLSRLDYDNAVLVGLPAYLYNRLQSVLNAAARSIVGLGHSDHITDTFASFHWLKARSVFGSRWQQLSIVHWTVRLLTTWLQVCTVCLVCRPDDVCNHHSLTSSMSASRSV